MSFDRSRLPDPLSYYEGQGLHFKEHRGKWRSAACFNCSSSDGMRVNTENGSFVCMTQCGARGGDLLAYHMAHHSLDFITAAKELGAWVDDGKPTLARPTPLPARDALAVLGVESNLVAVAAANVAHGVALSELDLARLLQAAGRIQKVAEVFS